jgi:hypothetical protein
MVCALLLLVGLSSLSRYASRAALTLVILGNGLLVLFWYTSDAYLDVADDRTGSIRWAFAWNTEDPVYQTNHGAISFPPAYGQGGTIYLLRQHDYTNPKGLSLVALNPAWRWEIRPDGGICTLPTVV